MNILVCTDLSVSSDKVLEQAETIAKASAAKLWIVHVVSADQGFAGYEMASLTQSGVISYEIDSQSNSQPIRSFISQNIHKSHRKIQEVSSSLREEGLDSTALLIQGATVETILLKASKLHVDMIIIGSHGRGVIHQMLLGSISEKVIQNSPCPILVVPVNERS